jgi:GAF domain-containing protein
MPGRFAADTRLAMIDSNAPDLAHKRLSFLAEASHILASSLDVAVTLQQAARLTIPGLADACVMYLVDADGAAQATAVAHAQPEDEAALWELQRRYPDPAGSRGALGRVLASGESVCFPDSDPVARLARARDPLHRSLLERLNTNSAMIVAMVARGQVIGALSLMTSISGRRYTDEDVRFAEDLARRCALAVDNARLYEGAQREIAERKRAEAAVAELAQAKEELVSMISHELRSPAAVLIGYAELLARDNVSEAERHEIATAMVQQGRQLS